MPAIRYFLDTHILIWWLENSPRLTKAQARVLQEFEQNKPFGVSDISLLEIGYLVSAGRIQVKGELRDWLSRATAGPLVRLCRITPAVVAEAANLPSDFHRDPADRIITATARLERARLLTQDRKIIDSDAVPCL